jgi:hypothetical protein
MYVNTCTDRTADMHSTYSSGVAFAIKVSTIKFLQTIVSVGVRAGVQERTHGPGRDEGQRVWSREQALYFCEW